MDTQMVLFNKYEKDGQIFSYNCISHGKFKQRVKNHLLNTCHCCPSTLKDQLSTIPLLVDSKQKTKCTMKVRNTLKMLEQIVITDYQNKDGYSYKCFTCKDVFDSYESLEEHTFTKL